MTTEIERLIYTANAIERLSCVVRKETKTRVSFPNNTALKKVLCLAVKNIVQKRKRSFTYQRPTVSELAIQQDDHRILLDDYPSSRKKRFYSLNHYK